MSARPQTAGRRPQGESPSCSLQPQASSLTLDRAEAITAKRSLQSALELATRARADLMPGPKADALDHIARLICVGITALRDADSDSNCGVRKIERTDPSDKSASSPRKGARA